MATKPHMFLGRPEENFGDLTIAGKPLIAV